TKEHMAAFRVTKGEFGKRVLNTCFLGFLWSLEDVLKENFVWPVMERDRSDLQELLFSSPVRDADHAVARLPDTRKLHSVDFSRVGETLYSNKYSALASAADICGYLLHKKFLRDNGVSLNTYSAALAGI